MKEKRRPRKKYCELCGRLGGHNPYRSKKRHYFVYLRERHPHKLVCQWCRSSLNSK